MCLCEHIFLFLSGNYPVVKRVGYVVFVYVCVCVCVCMPPCSSNGKESAYNAGDQALIPGSGRSAGDGNGCPLQYS